MIFQKELYIAFHIIEYNYLQIISFAVMQILSCLLPVKTINF